ncbi:unnamed protein product [Blepharisma stoltei]|uniref:Small-subunit processome Utp12 domain-containing protein n=1 Tax=Blepharisma stoltei TaxID=1481888 RepID=A0AAU9JFW3_9CILI|nr:unnamed protein product [Blepharisma stoltei]
MAKSYFAFQFKSSFGEITSSNSHLIVSSNDWIFTSSNESVLIWSAKRLELIKSLSQGPDIITSLALSTNSLSAGFRNGTILVWSLSSWEILHKFEGHESAVSALTYSSDGLTLYSGSYDTSIIVWDLVADAASVRLQGHKDSITSLIVRENSLISGSRDRMIKIWDLISEMCSDTLLSSSEVWSLEIIENKLYAGSGDKYIHVWDCIDNYKELGAISKQIPKGRTKSVSKHPNESIFLVVSKGSLEVWRTRKENEIDKMMKRRRKRLREKGKDEEEVNMVFTDYYERIVLHKPDSKIASAQFFPTKYKSSTHEHKFKIAISYATNYMQIYDLSCNLVTKVKTAASFELISTLDREGHRSSARTLSLSQDNWNLLSGSGESLKIWDLKTQTCISTLECDYALTSLFLPGDRFVIIGTRSGLLQAFDILSHEKIFEKKGHEGSVWSICLFPSSLVLISGGADHDLKFWQIRLQPEFKLKLTEVFSLKDEILSVKCSPDGKLICSSLLDSTIQTIYSDSKKLYLSLYGHKLPASCFDISSDSLILVSGSADKNLKLWGLDYGDCHKSIFAHDQPISDVKFVKDTHLFFSAGRDRLIKYWNADTYECILTLKGHKAEIWSIILSSAGDFLVSAGNDYSLRLWVQTSEQIFLEEEKEKEIEESTKPEELGIQKPVGEAVPVLRTTNEALKAGEVLIEALEVARQYREHLSQGGNALPPPHYGGLDEHGYILKILTGIPSSSFDSAIQMLPFAYATMLFYHLESYLDKGVETELTVKCILMLMKIHENTLVSSVYSNEEWLIRIERVKSKMMSRIKEIKDVIGRNVAACKFVARYLQDQKGMPITELS